MTSKRHHTKSRLGCKQCKGRRIKCDQTPPCCVNCAKRGVECEYQEWAQLLTPASFPYNALQSSPASPSRRHDSSTHSECFNFEDLGLLHHFTVHASQTLDRIGSEQFRQIWQYEVPLLGVSHPPLMHALLAFAAAHQATANDPAVCGQQDLQVARKHFSKALVLFRASVKDVTAEKPEVLLPYCILVCFLTLFFEFDKPIDEQDPIGDFVSLLGIVGSSTGVIELVRERLRSTGVGRLLDHTQDRPVHAIAPEVGTSLGALDNLVQSHRGKTGFESGTIAILNDAILKLRGLYSLIDPRPASWAYLLRWPIELCPEFGTLLLERNPIALCILAHWFVPAHNAPARWHVADWPRRTMIAIAQELKSDEWDNGIKWPLTEILG